MKISLTPYTYALALVSAIAIAGCSSGSSNPDNNDNDAITYTGSTSPAAISASNAEEIGTSATEGVVQAVEVETSGDALPFAVAISKSPRSQLNQKLREISRHLIDSKRSIDLPLGLVMDGSDDFPDDMGYCGGSITIPDNMYNDTSGNINGTITYNNLCMDAGVGYGRMTVNGSIIFSQTETRFSMTYRNLTVSYNGETYTMNSTYACDILSSGAYNCSTSSDYAGSDGSTYRMSDVSISGNNSAGYSVDASFCHPNYGCVTIVTTSPITFNCENGMPDSGAISYTGASGSSGTISFDSCSGYSGTYDDGSGSIASFIGSWPS